MLTLCIQNIREVFSSALLEEMEILLSSFKEDCPIFSFIDDSILGTTLPSATKSSAIFIEKVKLEKESIDMLFSSIWMELGLSVEQEQTFTYCNSLFNLLAYLPCG